MKRKGQAAMEFLMTYGWAILAAVIVIGVLAYFGVFNPGKYAPKTCMISAPFGMSSGDCQASATNGVQLAITNGAGESITIYSVSVTNCGTNNTQMSVADGAKQTVIVTCSPALTQGNNFKGDVTVTYKRGDAAFNETSTGKIIQTVVA